MGTYLERCSSPRSLENSSRSWLHSRFTNPQEQNEQEPQMEMESEEPDLLQLEKIAIAITKAEKEGEHRVG
ncbi:GD18478 [Drosophila simulans]|uniref:GD18478 n=1 Tax=Drosophila simulans TaxID=7240 RepID=B4QZX5_DROSI|nr:GD18478 [Drosophila simulans]